MIRTKDLVLFLLSFLILFFAITSTLASQRSSHTRTQEVSFVDEEVIESEAVYENEELDRQSIIARLREAVFRAETISAPVVAVVDSSQEESEEEINPGLVTLNKCTTMKDAISFASLWPRSGVLVQVAEGVRSVAQVTEVLPKAPVSGASSTVETGADIKIRPLIQLPLSPTLGEANCLASEIVGVSTSGALLFNSDAIAYRSRQQSELLGYARDGVPIYGLYEGNTDECGGYEINGEYRYSVSTDRNYILGCYKGAPQSFIGE